MNETVLDLGGIFLIAVETLMEARICAFLKDDPKMRVAKLNSALYTALVKNKCAVFVLYGDTEGGLCGFTQHVVFSVGIGVVSCQPMCECHAQLCIGDLFQAHEGSAGCDILFGIIL